MAALLHGHGQRLLGERLPDLGEVAVLVELVTDLEKKSKDNDKLNHVSVLQKDVLKVDGG